MDKHLDAIDRNPHCDLCGLPLTSGEPAGWSVGAQEWYHVAMRGSGSIRGLSSREHLIRLLGPEFRLGAQLCRYLPGTLANVFSLISYACDFSAHTSTVAEFDVPFFHMRFLVEPNCSGSK